jgi:ribosome-binding factor A
MKRENEGSRFAKGDGGFRHQRIEVSMAEELRVILRDDVTDPDLEGVRIGMVVLSVDYKSARVHFAVPHGLPRLKAERAFERATPFLRGRIAESIELKRTPELRFVFETELPDLV